MIKKIIRIVATIVGVIAGYGIFPAASFVGELTGLYHLKSLDPLHRAIAIAAFSVAFGFLFFIMTPMFGRHGARMAKNIESDLQTIPANDLIAGTAGLVIGLIIAFLISPIFSDMGKYAGVTLSIVTYITMGFFGVVVATKKGKDLISAWASLRRGAASPKARGKGADATPKILDTSVIIDGRIADIMKTGFIEGPIVIPEFVLVELRHIADSSDGLKRNRGRRGLDVLNKIQTEHGVDIYNTEADKNLEEIPEVDVKLLKLAQILHGKVVTNDFNLNKVATIKGVEVLNINELANTLKPVVLPGEDMNIFPVKEGKENNQAVAYLDDGTMIVVEEGRKFIGKSVDVLVTSVLQTSAGRMIFAKPKGKQSNVS
ncbi:MAG: PIN/TRAM domain-containing protein [Clostridiales Family XIII bacterium]|nr:PIN/TRAM domain-containing protein [Clostridiales Family XIII bacterium]